MRKIMLTVQAQVTHRADNSHPTDKSLSLRLFKNFSHTMLRMAKNLNASNININNGRLNIASLISPTKRTTNEAFTCFIHCLAFFLVVHLRRLL